MIEALLKKLELRDPLRPDERAALADSFSPPKSHAAREHMVEQGTRPKHSTLLLNGLTARVTTLAEGSQQITALHIPGDFVDLHSFLLPRMDHSVVAISDCVVTTVDHDRLREITSAFPHLTRLLWLNTLMDSAIHRQWLVTLGRMSASGRMAHLLCELYRRHAVVDGVRDDGFDLPMTQAQLADVLGLSAVHVNRTLQELRAQGVVSWNGARVKITNWEDLARMGEFDPTYLQLERSPV